MKWYFQNLRYGARYAFFFPSAEKFIASWHALMAIAATIVLSQGLLEFIVVGKSGETTYMWYGYQVCLFSLTLVTSYIIGSIACKGERILDIAVALLNSYYYIFIPYALLQIMAPAGFHDSGLATFTEYVIPVWGFLVMFRIVNVYMADRTFIKPLISGLLAAGLLYVLNSEVYFTRFYYVDDASEQAQPSALDKLTSEEVFNMQPALRQKGLDTLKVSRKGQTDIYALSLGTYAYQDVFMRDVNYVSERLKSKLGVTNLISMLNNKKTVETTALANATNLQSYLEKLSTHYMQPEEDIALIYLTSHGGQKTGLSVNLGYQYSQLDLTPERLAKILKDSGIQNKIIIIAACYSGVFVPALKDEHTIVITAAAEDRVSFGCSDENNLTYFTEAYFMNALSKTTDLEKAFDIAKQVVEKREKEEKVEEGSNPQIFVGSKIREILRKYKGANLVSDFRLQEDKK